MINTVFTQNGTRTITREEAEERRALLERFSHGARSFQSGVVSVEPREEFQGDFCDLTVVYRGESDVIFQLFPRAQVWPPKEADALALLSRLIESYFGATGRFSAAPFPELKSWAVLATALRDTPTYTREHCVVGFADFVNRSLAAFAKERQ